MDSWFEFSLLETREVRQSSNYLFFWDQVMNMSINLSINKIITSHVIKLNQPVNKNPGDPSFLKYYLNNQQHK